MKVSLSCWWYRSVEPRSRRPERAWCQAVTGTTGQWSRKGLVAQERQVEWVLSEYGNSPTVPTQVLLQVLQSELLVRSVA